MGQKRKKKNNNNTFTLKMALLKPSSGVYHYGPSLLDHCILSSGLDPVLALDFSPLTHTESENDAKNLILNPDILSHEQISILLNKLKHDGNNIIESLTTNHRKEEECKGFILYQMH